MLVPGRDAGPGFGCRPCGFRCFIRGSFALPSSRVLEGLWTFLGCIHRFQFRARLGPSWHTVNSPSTDPTVQIFRSGFV